MNPCDATEPVSCETCGDSGWVITVIFEGIYGTEYADVMCVDCDGQTPAFLVGVDDVLDGQREGWDR